MSTRATEALQRVGVAFILHVYDFQPGGKDIGTQAVAAPDVPAGGLLKTLLVAMEGALARAVVSADREFSPMRLAALGGRAVSLDGARRGGARFQTT